MLVLDKKETIIEKDNIIENYYIVEEKYMYAIYEFVGANDRYILLKFVERISKKSNI